MNTTELLAKLVAFALGFCEEHEMRFSARTHCQYLHMHYLSQGERMCDTFTQDEKRVFIQFILLSEGVL